MIGVSFRAGGALSYAGLKRSVAEFKGGVSTGREYVDLYDYDTAYDFMAGQEINVAKYSRVLPAGLVAPFVLPRCCPVSQERGPHHRLWNTCPRAGAAAIRSWGAVQLQQPRHHLVRTIQCGADPTAPI
eukprot:SAG11_NODE_300_length_11057_cov_5.223469_3_plen_129_part_00